MSCIKHFAHSQFYSKIIGFYKKKIIGVISLTMGKIVFVLGRATERTKNFSIIFIHFVDI